MADHERATWDQRYGEGSYDVREPNRFLPYAFGEFIAPLFPRPGVALDLAGGTGRHALFLAEGGWRVTLMDISQVAIDRARAAAAERGVSGVDFVVGDARALDFGRSRYDLVVVTFYLERELFPKIAAVLRPGGLVVYKTFTRENERFAVKGTSHPEYFLASNELLSAFPGFAILHYHESMREKGMAELVARKP